MDIPSPQAASAEGPHTAFDLVRLVEIARARCVVIVSGVLCGMALAIAYCAIAPPVYESTTQILVMTKNANLPTQGVEATRELSNTVAEDLLATHMQLLQSPRVVQRALAQRSLENLPSIINNLDDDQTPTDYVIEQLNVRRGGAGKAKQAHVIEVALQLKSPEDSAEVLNAIVESYQDFLGETFRDVSKEAVELISQAKDDLETQLKEQEQAYITFRETAPLMWQGEQSLNLHQLRAAELNRLMTETRTRYLSVRSRLDLVNSTLASSDEIGMADLDRMALFDERDVQRLSLLVDVENGEATSEAFQAKQPLRSETARSEYDNLVALKLQESTLLNDLGPEHPRVKETQQSITELSKLLAGAKDSLGTVEDKPRVSGRQLAQTYSTVLENDLRDLEMRMKQLEEQYKAEETSARAIATYEVEGQTLAKDVARRQALYDAVVDRLREINLVKDYGGYITEVISPVELGEHCWPKIPLLLVLGAFGGMVLGGGAALGMELFDQTFRTVDEARMALDLPLLACVPDLHKAEEIVRAKTDADEDHRRIAPSILAYHRPKSRESEAIRGLRTSLYFKNGDGRIKVLQVTSANSGDGKTTTASNLAVSLAQSGKRVLIIDADLRRPRVGATFGIESQVGLSSVIAHDAELVDAVQATPINNLSVLPCGPIPPNPAELLDQPRFAELLGVLREQYDYVIVDTPPLLAVSDPMAVAQKADAVIFVAKLTNSRHATMRARDLLADPAIKLLGLVVNGVQSSSVASYSYGGYYYGSEANDNYFSDHEPVAGAERS